MMRVLSTFLVTLGLATTMARAQEINAVVSKPDVDVYAEPKLDSGKVTLLKRDAAVGIRAQNGLWYEVRLPDGKTGFVRVNDVRVDFARAEGAGANFNALKSGKSGAGRVTETAGVRGIDESDLKAGARDAAQLDAMVGQRKDASAGALYAGEHGWQATQVEFSAELKPGGDNAASAVSLGAKAAGAAQSAGAVAGALGEKLGSLFGAAKKAAPKPEQDQAAEELALGPEIAGRVLGVRPLLNDTEAQKRVNVVGRWVASQTSRPDLPWTFGVIDTPEVNAFAAPGGYILLTRGLYELLSSDSELAAVLSHEISHCVQRDHYNVIRKQELTALGTESVAAQIDTGSGSTETFVRNYVEQHGATIMLTALDREAEFRADQAAEIYLARSGMNPIALYSVLQKMVALGEQSASLAALYKTHPPLNTRLDRIDQRNYEGMAAYTSRP